MFNADYANRYGIIGTVPHAWNGYFNSVLNANLFLSDQKGIIRDIPFHTKKVSGILTLSNTILLNKQKTLSLQLSGLYRTLQHNYILTHSETWYASAGLSWTPKKSGWSIIMKATDIFNTDRNYMAYHYGLQNMDMENNKDFRQLTLNVRYVFKSVKQKKGRVVDTSRMGM